jgi:adenosylcobinamide kinase/adenosylcobinamide-phosphate guanylyltransferase
MPVHEKTITLVLGGARSGKTEYAENHALSLAADSHSAIYIATSQAIDDEMQARIDRHRDLRSNQFTTIEAPLNLAHVLEDYNENHVLLVDSIGAWITNHMMAEHDLDNIINCTITALEKTNATVVLVSDEVGMGIIPAEALSRDFRDHIGMMNQRVGQLADSVAFLVAGLPMMIKTTDK